MLKFQSSFESLESNRTRREDKAKHWQNNKKWDWVLTLRDKTDQSIIARVAWVPALTNETEKLYPSQHNEILKKKKLSETKHCTFVIKVMIKEKWKYHSDF